MAGSSDLIGDGYPRRPAPPAPPADAPQPPGLRFPKTEAFSAGVRQLEDELAIPNMVADRIGQPYVEMVLEQSRFAHLQELCQRWGLSPAEAAAFINRKLQGG